jgi:hypothetical protein
MTHTLTLSFFHGTGQFACVPDVPICYGRYHTLAAGAGSQNRCANHAAPLHAPVSH